MGGAGGGDDDDGGLLPPALASLAVELPLPLRSALATWSNISGVERFLSSVLRVCTMPRALSRLGLTIWKSKEAARGAAEEEEEEEEE